MLQQQAPWDLELQLVALAAEVQPHQLVQLPQQLRSHTVRRSCSLQCTVLLLLLPPAKVYSSKWLLQPQRQHKQQKQHHSQVLETAPSSLLSQVSSCQSRRQQPCSQNQPLLQVQVAAAPQQQRPAHSQSVSQGPAALSLKQAAPQRLQQAPLQQAGNLGGYVSSCPSQGGCLESQRLKHSWHPSQQQQARAALTQLLQAQTALQALQLHWRLLVQ